MNTKIEIEGLIHQFQKAHDKLAKQVSEAKHYTPFLIDKLTHKLVYAEALSYFELMLEHMKETGGFKAGSPAWQEEFRSMMSKTHQQMLQRGRDGVLDMNRQMEAAVRIDSGRRICAALAVLVRDKEIRKEIERKYEGVV